MILRNAALFLDSGRLCRAVLVLSITIESLRSFKSAMHSNKRGLAAFFIIGLLSYNLSKPRGALFD